MMMQVHRSVEAGLATEGWQQGVGSFLLDDLGDHLPGDRFNVGPIRRLRIGHDRGRIRIDEDDLVALFAEGLARLRAGIIELARLTNDNGTRTDDEDLAEVGTFRHGAVEFSRS